MKEAPCVKTRCAVRATMHSMHQSPCIISQADAVSLQVGDKNTYKVVVKTSDLRGAGTDSNIQASDGGQRAN